jgi:hypothetical protein
MESNANGGFHFVGTAHTLFAWLLLPSRFSAPGCSCGLLLQCTATRRSCISLRVCYPTVTERERERLSFILCASSIKQERAIDNVDTGMERKKGRKKEETHTHTERRTWVLRSDSTLSAGGSATQTHTYKGTLRESAKRDPQ